VKKRVPAKYYTAIGRVASAWAMFELHINFTIWELANVQQQHGACITAQILAPVPRFKALVALFQLRGASETAIGKINGLAGTANDLANKRNRLVHDASFIVPATGVFQQLRITADRKLDFGLVPVSIEEIDEIERRIRKLIKDTGKAIQDAIDGLPPYDKTQFELSEGVGLNRRKGPSIGRRARRRQRPPSPP
jgi:hypothetical protein